MSERPIRRFFEGDLAQLRSFYYAAQLNSFTRAAEQTATTQPRISTHVKQLEALTGHVLFTRNARGVALTPAGQALLNLVQPFVEAIDQLPERLDEQLAEHGSDEVRLAAGHELLLHLAGPVLQAYRAANPNVRLVVYGSVRRQTQEMVANDEVDFGIASVSGLSHDLTFEHILTDELVLICPPEHPLASRRNVRLADIAQYPVLMPDPESSTRAFVEEAFAQSNLELRVAMELERWHVIREFVALGQGIALVPRFSVAEQPDRLVILPVRDSLPVLSYGIVTRRGHYLSPPVRSLIEAIRLRGERLASAGSPIKHQGR
jgi:LysR family cys regulon transcriptional activator